MMVGVPSLWVMTTHMPLPKTYLADTRIRGFLWLPRIAEFNTFALKWEDVTYHCCCLVLARGLYLSRGVVVKLVPLPVGLDVTFSPSKRHLLVGRYGSADELPRRDHCWRLSVPRGWSVNGLGSWLCLVRIDGERTTKRPPRSKGEVTTGGWPTQEPQTDPNRARRQLYIWLEPQDHDVSDLELTNQ